MRKYYNVKIVVLGHACSGKSTYAQYIADVLSKKNIPVEVRDCDKPIDKSTMRKRLEGLADRLKQEDSKVIIETKQANRSEKIL